MSTDAAARQHTMGEETITPAPLRRRGGWRLWVPLAAALLLPAAILGTGAWGAWHLAWTEIERDLIRGAEVNADYVERSLGGLARTAERVAAVTGQRDDVASAAGRDLMRDRVIDIVREQALLHAVTVLAPSGQQILQVLAPLRPGGTADPPGGEIQEALEQVPPGRIAVGRAYAAPGGARFAIGLRSQPSGTTVIFVLDAALIGEALGRHTDSDADAVALIRRDGQVLARRPGFVEPPPRLGTESPIMRQIAEGRRGGSLMGGLPLDGDPVAAAFCRIEGFPDLFVVVGRSRADIVDRWRVVLLPLLLVGLPSVFALMGLALVVRRQQEALEAALDGLEQRVADRTDSLREGEERLRLAVDAGELGTWETDLRSGQSTRSPRAIAILGFPPDIASSASEDWSARIHPNDRRRVLEGWGRLGAGQAAVYRAEYRFLRPDGAWRWFESTGAVVRTHAETGEPLRLAGTIQDITARREAEERRDLLTQEVNHRARNTLAIVQAILRLTQADSPAEFARLVEGRIAALARAQSLLAAEHWTGASLATLAVDELAPFGAIPSIGGAEGRFRVDGAAFRVRAEVVQALGMVFHELATNAAKHGALSVPGGSLTIAWSVDEAAAMLRIRWTETGGPPPGFPSRRGVGSRVIEATVSGQLGGVVDRRWPDEGLICDIVLPLGRTRAGPA